MLNEKNPCSVEEKKDVRFEVTYGSKKESERNKETFNNEESALQFFKEKDKENMSVDAYKVETKTVITKTKLSS